MDVSRLFSGDVPGSKILFFHAGTTPILEKKLRECRGKWKSFMWVPINSENCSGSCSENYAFRIAQVVRCHSENGISHSENRFLNSESWSENTPELSESSENGLFTPRAFFLASDLFSCLSKRSWAVVGVARTEDLSVSRWHQKQCLVMPPVLLACRWLSRVVLLGVVLPTFRSSSNSCVCVCVFFYCPAWLA